MDGFNVLFKVRAHVGEVLGNSNTPTADPARHRGEGFAPREARSHALTLDRCPGATSVPGTGLGSGLQIRSQAIEIAELLISEIGEGTVDFQKNYDGKSMSRCMLTGACRFRPGTAAWHSGRLIDAHPGRTT